MRARPNVPYAVLPAVLAAVLAGCASGSEAPKADTAPAEHAAAHWGYEGDVGPDRWADLDPAFALARTGRRQSPVDVRTADVVEGRDPAPAFAWRAGPLTVENNGHTVQVTCAPGGTLTVGNDAYELKQFHFHAPSEHTVDGEHAALEVHFVHSGPDGRLAVVGLLVRPGSPDGTLGAVLEHAPRAKGGPVSPGGVSVDPAGLLPGDRGLWRYDGSLTTPPCTEGVHWFLLRTPREAAPEQLDGFREILRGNNRPTQPLHGRTVESAR